MFDRATAERAKRADLEVARVMGDAHKVGQRGRLVRSVDVRAVMNAVNQEGREVLSEAGEGYWRDMDRLHPHIRRAPSDGVSSVRGMRNRFGRVKERIVYG